MFFSYKPAFLELSGLIKGWMRKGVIFIYLVSHCLFHVTSQSIFVFHSELFWTFPPCRKILYLKQLSVCRPTILLGSKEVGIQSVFGKLHCQNLQIVLTSPTKYRLGMRLGLHVPDPSIHAPWWQSLPSLSGLVQMHPCILQFLPSGPSTMPFRLFILWTSVQS